jgi:hypothetical protein
MNLMKHIPKAVQAVANDEHNRQPETENTEHGEHNHRSGFKSPRFLVSEIGGERQIKCRDCNEKQSKKDLLCFPGIFTLGGASGMRLGRRVPADDDRC